jgi:hypothetical protein
MAGSKWSSTEIWVLIECNKRRLFHREIVAELKRKVGTERTLTAIRSQLDELKKKRGLYDHSQEKWIDFLVDLYLLGLEAEEHERSDD